MSPIAPPIAIRRLAPYGLAGIALVGVVLDQIDVPHDNWLCVGILGAGGVAGLASGVVASRSVTLAGSAPRLADAAWTVVRLFLAFEMVRYGTAKVVGMQFYPQYWRLDARVVDLKSSWLAWTFFGRSYGYQAVGGVIEVASGVLVAFRRTTLLGACIMATALVNVVLVNFFYDVPVKLFASLYLVMDVSLIVRDGPRLRAFFLPAPDERSRSRVRALAATGIALVLGLPVADTLHDAYRYGIFRAAPLEGAWRVDRQVGLDDLLPAASGQWDRVYFEKGDFGFVRVGGQRVGFATHVDTAASTLTLSRFGGAQSSALNGSFAQHEPSLHIEGSRGGKPFALDLTRELPPYPGAAPAGTIPGAIMSWQEYERRGDPPAPYILRLKPARGELLYVGIAHSYDPADTQFAALEHEWREFHPTEAFNEGGDPPIEQDLATAIQRHGESGYLRFIGARDSVRVWNIEPPADLEARTLLASFSAEQLRTFYVLRQVEHYHRAHLPQSLDDYTLQVLRGIDTRPGLKGARPHTLDELQTEARAMLPELADWREVPHEAFDPAGPQPLKVTQLISQRASDVRDEWVVRLLVDEVQRGQRVLAVMGSSHVVMQEPALRAALR